MIDKFWCVFYASQCSVCISTNVSVCCCRELLCTIVCERLPLTQIL